MPRKNVTGNVWRFRTANFQVELRLERDFNYRYDGDDEDGKTQAAIDSGEYVAFNAFVSVFWNGEQIGQDALHGSVYGRDEVVDFYTAHRDANPMNRNSSIMRAAEGLNVCICHYFPGMVLEAIKDARREIARRKNNAARLPRLRVGA